MRNELLPRLAAALGMGAAVLSASLAWGQAPPPVPALPDTERRTQYSISATTCACAVNFAIFGSGSDVDSWIEVWIGATRYLSTDPTFGWSLSSPTGTLATIPRPITNAVLTFNAAHTGVVQIVGAERPRRLSQFQENRGVAARDLNQVLTDLTAQNRETWDRTNDITGRTLRAPPGETFPTLPSATSRAGGLLAFDGSGNGVIQPNVPAGSIPTNSITNSLLAQMPANTTKCNPTGSVANTQDCTATQLASIFPGAAVGSVLTYGAAPAWLANSIGLNGAAGQSFISGEPAYVLELINNNSALQLLRISTYGTAPSGGENNVHWVRMDGTAASPTNTKTGMFFLSFGTRGNDGQAGVAGNTGSSAAFQSIACSNWTSSDHCTEFDWATTPLGSTTRTNTMRLANGGLNLSGAVWQGGGYIGDGTAAGITISCGRILGGLLERVAGPVAPFTDTTATAQQIVQCANTQGGGPGNGANVPIHTYFTYSNKSGQTATLAGGTGVTMGAAGGGAALSLATGTAAMWEVIIENSTLGAEAVRIYRTN